MKKNLLCFLPVAIAAVALSFWKVADPDVFWHLKAGQLMLEQGRLVTQNTFSALFPDHPWQDNEWLFQILLAGVYNAWGWSGVAGFKIVVVLALGALLFATMLSRSDRPLLAATGAITALAIMQHRLTERPHLFSYVFLALTVLLVARSDRYPRRLWALPPLFALWSNIHPEVLFGLLYLGLASVGVHLNKLVHGAEAAPGARRLPLVTLACLGATLVNPWGFQLFTMPFSIIKHDHAVIEYTFSTFSLFPSLWVFFALTLLLVATARRRRDWAEILPVLTLGLLAVLMQRVIPIFVVAATPFVFSGAADLSANGGRWRRSRVEAVCSLCAYAALVWALAFERQGLYVWGWGIHEGIYPAAAADLLSAEPWRGNLYNPYREGGYLIYRLYPKMGVLQDGRGGAYPRPFVSRLNDAFNVGDLPRILSDYEIKLALFPLDEVNAGFNRSGWGVVFWDDDYCLMVRRDSLNKELLERLEYRFFLPGVDPSRETEPGNLAALIGEMEKNQAARRSPSAVLANTLGFLYLRTGGIVEAEGRFRQATRIDEKYGPAWANLGLLLMKTGRTKQAEAALTQAVGLDPGLEMARARLGELRNALRR